MRISCKFFPETNLGMQRDAICLAWVWVFLKKSALQNFCTSVKVIYPARVFHGFLLLASVPVTYWKRWRSARGFHNIWLSAQAYIGTARCRGVEHFNPWPFWCLLDVVGPTGWPYFFYILLVGGFNHFFPIIYGNVIIPYWLIFSEGLEPPTSLCHSYVDYIDPFRCCWYSLQAPTLKNIAGSFCCFSTVRSAHGPVFISSADHGRHGCDGGVNINTITIRKKRTTFASWKRPGPLVPCRVRGPRGPELAFMSIGYESQNGLGKSKLPSGKLT